MTRGVTWVFGPVGRGGLAGEPVGESGGGLPDASVGA